MTAIAAANFELGRVVGQALGLAGRNFVPFFLLALVFIGIPYGAVLYAQSYLVATDPSMGIAVAVGGAIMSVITNNLLQAALSRASVDALSGAGLNLGAALGAGFRYIFPLIGLGILVGLGTGLGFMLLIVPGLILLVRWLVSAPALVVEDLSITRAMERSGDLGAGHRWAIFGLVLIFAFISYGADFGLAMATNSSSVYLGDPNAPLDLSLTYLGASLVLQSLVAMLGAVGVASIYFELRRAKEGIGMTELAAVFD